MNSSKKYLKTNYGLACSNLVDSSKKSEHLKSNHNYTKSHKDESCANKSFIRIGRIGRTNSVPNISTKKGGSKINYIFHNRNKTWNGSKFNNGSKSNTCTGSGTGSGTKTDFIIKKSESKTNSYCVQFGHIFNKVKIRNFYRKQRELYQGTN